MKVPFLVVNSKVGPAEVEVWLGVVVGHRLSALLSSLVL